MTTLTHGPPPGETTAGQERDDATAHRWPGLLPIAASTLAGVAGLALVWWSYRLAFHEGGLHYPVFWAGCLVACLPMAARACARLLPAWERLTHVVLLSTFLMGPKLLRTPDRPLYHDEYAHLVQAENLAQSGRLFADNWLVPVIKSYPGLHTVTAFLIDLSGVPSWRAGQLLILLTHVLTAVGTYAVAAELWRSHRAGAVGACVYMLNAGYMYFDSQFSYEGMALALFVWIGYLSVRMLRCAERSAAWRLAPVAGLLGAALVTTHHLTAIGTVVLLLVSGLSTAVLPRARSACRAGLVPMLVTTGGITALLLVWLLAVSPYTLRYLSPYLGTGLRQLAGIVATGSGGRELYAASTTPGYERAAAFLSFAVLGAVAVAHLVRSRWLRDDARDGARLGWVLYGGLYFLSVPLILSPMGAEASRRTWAFTFLGVSVIAAGLFAGPPRARSWPRGAAAALAFVIVLVGNVSAGQNEYYRFPGRIVFGTDTRDVSSESLALAEWLRGVVPPGRRVATDRFNGLQLAYTGGLDIVRATDRLPYWELYLESLPPSPRLADEMRRLDVAYLVLDKRMTRALPVLGVYFQPDEAFTLAEPLAPEQLDRYYDQPWASIILDSTSVRVVRIDLDLFVASSRSAR
ncbi:hypothetical protein DMB66_40355 [Actinoplanes sp. ATCC 53533]|uniref:hypothetical protein n=1 Tax=Actinoplanes sp. ATCC 53533 TaxID=1288362 RepID=UPI000F791229|nr:hypothetical protein [Actinoplanes sp. ATCC 53533]RSM52173.1 hypothetical protein DMB66_40355 [Actinoplanes sp. ATCC 53533]